MGKRFQKSPYSPIHKSPIEFAAQTDGGSVYRPLNGWRSAIRRTMIVADLFISAVQTCASSFESDYIWFTGKLLPPSVFYFALSISHHTCSVYSGVLACLPSNRNVSSVPSLLWFNFTMFICFVFITNKTHSECTPFGAGYAWTRAQFHIPGSVSTLLIITVYRLAYFKFPCINYQLSTF